MTKSPTPTTAGAAAHLEFTMGFRMIFPSSNTTTTTGNTTTTIYDDKNLKSSNTTTTTIIYDDKNLKCLIFKMLILISLEFCFISFHFEFLALSCSTPT
jgi:hypothetical protein